MDLHTRNALCSAVLCCILISCGASRTSTGAQIADTYYVNGRPTGSTCPTGICTEFDESWTIDRANGKWLLTIEGASGEGTLEGDTMTAEIPTAVTGSACTIDLVLSIEMTITKTGFSGASRMRAKGPTCSPPADCTCTYALTATR